MSIQTLQRQYHYTYDMSLRLSYNNEDSRAENRVTAIERYPKGAAVTYWKCVCSSISCRQYSAKVLVLLIRVTYLFVVDNLQQTTLYI